MNKNKYPNNMTVAVGLSALMSGTPAAFGQEALEEVLVTATKRAASLQDVPVTVSAVGEELIKDAGINGVEDLQHTLPALNVSANINAFSAAIRLRGIGSQGNEPSIEPSVGFFVDGVYQARSGLGLSDIADVERIEVLYGPQSTLYGKNTNAGLINIITKAPSDEFEGNIELTGGDYSLKDVRLSLSGPITDTTAFRINGRYHKRDGYLDDVDPAGGGGGEENLNDVDDQVLRAQLRFTPNDDMDIRLIGAYVKREQNCCSAELDPGPLHLGLAAAFGAPLPSTDPTDRVVGVDYPYTFKQDSYSLSAIVNYDLGSMSLTSITAYDEYDWDHQQDTDHSPFDFWRVEDHQEGDSFSQEFRLSSNGGEQLNWLAGLYYYSATMKRGEGQLPGYVSFGQVAGLVLPGSLPPPLTAAAGDTGIYDATWDQKSMAVYGQIDYAVNDKLTLLAGLRFTHEEKDADLKLISQTASPLSVMALAILPPLDEQLSRTDDSFSWMTGLQYHFSDEVMAFVTVSTGAKAGGFNGAAGPRTGDQREYDEETSMNYELGIKSNLFNQRLKLNAALFMTEVDDFQNLSFDAVAAAFFVENAGKQTTAGLDIDSAWLVNDYLTLTAAASFLDTEYDSFTNGPCYFGRSDADPVSGACDVSGEELPWAPELTANIAANIEVPVGNNSVYGRLEYVYTSDHIAADDLDPRAEQNYDLLNARIGIRGENWDLALWGKNISDETYIVQTVGIPLFPGSYMTWLNPPRTWGATLRYAF
jgi:iron complex outermembrane receptor protein